ncbi:hypothetical protein XA68_12400 [Ophiocordyceps unilateralis]|uniref:Tyrosine specific protein phosphatases domain-containing protein n=1 Tax=Ophiocordyceps unilateralis TaxID=268505 RepID=A0A2A9PEV1_OPHUN|nr:hypothetical protein XA68_12400 [Ophiocordyceps unilateralis]
MRSRNFSTSVRGATGLLFCVFFIRRLPLGTMASVDVGGDSDAEAVAVATSLLPSIGTVQHKGNGPTTVAKSLHKRLRLEMQRRGPPPKGFDPAEVKRAGLQRFELVQDYFPTTYGPIYRSSAPFYRHDDASQRSSPLTAEFLQRHNIKTVISLNSRASDPAFRKLYKQYGIHYVAVPVTDMRAPSMRGMETIVEAFNGGRKHGGIIVWCGYGRGRAGTAITAMQISAQSELPLGRRTLVRKAQLKPLMTSNHVECS